MSELTDYSKVYREGFQLIRDVSSGRYSSERGTSVMSVHVLNPVAEALATLDAGDQASVADTRRLLKQLCETEHKVMSHYPAIMAFAFGSELPSTASN